LYRYRDELPFAVLKKPFWNAAPVGLMKLFESAG